MAPHRVHDKTSQRLRALALIERYPPEEYKLPAGKLQLADLAETAELDPNQLECPDTFAAAETTCTQLRGEQHERYTLAWIDGGSWLVEIVEAGMSP